MLKYKTAATHLEMAKKTTWYFKNYQEIFLKKFKSIKEVM